MARSTYVYIVTHRATVAPVAAFTVKYEAEQWIERSRWPKEQLRMFRTRDGGPGVRKSHIDNRPLTEEFTEIPL